MQRNFAVFILISLISAPIFPEKLLLLSDAPYVLDNGEWKNYFRSKSWKNEEILEADKEHLFIYLNSYRIPKNMNWNNPSWGLWNIRSNTFLPITDIPSNLIPIRKIGDRIFLKNQNNTSFFVLDEGEGKKPELIRSSIKVRGWFPRTDGSIVYILEGEDCEQFMGARQGTLWSICILGSDFETIQNVISVEPVFNPMLTGRSDNYIVFWQKNLDEKMWSLMSVDLNKGIVKLLYKSTREDLNQGNSPKWLSWIQRNWVVYEKNRNDEQNAGSENLNRSFIVHNLNSDQKKEILLERKGKILAEPGNIGSRKFQYQPFLIIMDYSGDNNPIKVIDIEELKIVFETIFPLENTLSGLNEQAVFYP